MGDKAQRLGEAMAAMSRNEVDRFGELLDDDVVWHWGGRSRVSGDYRGREAALGLLRGFQELTSQSLQVEPLDVLEGDDYLMSFTRVTAEQPDGQSLDVVMADAMRFGADGRVLEFWTLSNDQRAVDAFIG